MPDLPAAKIIRSKRKTLALRVLPDATLVVNAPLTVSQRAIDQFISEHSDWIAKRIQKVQAHPVALATQYAHGARILFLGTPHTLDIGNYTKIQAVQGKILFPKFLAFRLEKELHGWFIKQAGALITKQVAFYASEMQVAHTNLRFADTKSRWGACTHDNQLQFNWRLIFAPLLVINYVIVHELAHTIEKNHSYFFWSKVRTFTPSYRQQIKWLKEHGDLLMVA